ncbi:MAG: 4-phosphoerythronate dehydrogenase [Clostridium sp.]|nr:4-phosphoerythronate dehydrogenase [Clostridium sp.]
MENPSLKIVIESHIPFIRGIFEAAGIEVAYLAPEEITPSAVADADALIVRTRTRCDEALLGSSRCRIVATATIGTDHIDLGWAASRGIAVASAPGCNAPAVAQYVAGAVATWYPPAAMRRLTLGVVGYGHVGQIVERWARSIGMRTLLCDPPLEQGGYPRQFCSHETILRQADIVTYHVPLTRAGESPCPTFHMFDSVAAAEMRGGQSLINAARGPVADTAALVGAIRDGKLLHTAVDCWEGEPEVSRELLSLASIATPHVAGYSLQGKMRATRMAVDAVARFFGLEVEYPEEFRTLLPVPPSLTSSDLLEASLRLERDTAQFRRDPGLFETLRNTYDLRREPGQTAG